MRERLTSVAGTAASQNVWEELCHLAGPLHRQHLGQALQGGSWVDHGRITGHGKRAGRQACAAQQAAAVGASTAATPAAHGCPARPTCAAPLRSTALASLRSFSSSQGMMPPRPSSPMSAQGVCGVGLGGGVGWGVAGGGRQGRQAGRAVQRNDTSQQGSPMLEARQAGAVVAHAWPALPDSRDRMASPSQRYAPSIQAAPCQPASRPAARGVGLGGGVGGGVLTFDQGAHGFGCRGTHLRQRVHQRRLRRRTGRSQVCRLHHNGPGTSHCEDVGRQAQARAGS